MQEQNIVLSIAEAKRLMSDSNPEVLDVRPGQSWDKASMKVRGASRLEPDQVDSWMRNAKRDRAFFLFGDCEHDQGHALGMARRLRSCGCEAWAVAGGWDRWAGLGNPIERK